MHEKKNSVLVDFAMSQLMIEPSMYPPETISQLEEAFRRFVSDPSSRKESTEIINKYVDGDDIIMRMLDIINCVNEEPPKPPDHEEYGFERRKKTRGWTTIEDNRLIMAVNEFGIINLGAVAGFVGSGRSRSQCSQRWIRVLDPKLSKMPWKSEEDELLLSLCKSYGVKSWMKIATQIGNRSDVQCRYRYTQLTRDHKGKMDGIKPIDNENYNSIIQYPPSSFTERSRSLCQDLDQLNFDEMDFSNPGFQIYSDNNDIKMEFNIADTQLWTLE